MTDLGYLKWLEQQHYVRGDLRVELNEQIQRLEESVTSRGRDIGKKF